MLLNISCNALWATLLCRSNLVCILIISQRMSTGHIPRYFIFSKKKKVDLKTSSGAPQSIPFLFQSTRSTHITWIYAQDELLTPPERWDRAFCSCTFGFSAPMGAKRLRKAAPNFFFRPKIMKKNEKSIFLFFFLFRFRVSKWLKNTSKLSKNILFESYKPQKW